MLVIDGRRYGVPGYAGSSFLELPSLGIQSRKDWRPRPRDVTVRGIVVHTRMGLPVAVRPGIGPSLGWDKVLASRFDADERQASCHVAVDSDGSYACLADLQRVVTYHAGHVNEITVGIEMYQATDGVVCESTILATVAIIDVITREMGIQRQYPLENHICRRLASPATGVSKPAQLAYVPGGARGRDFCGVYGHRNVTRNRGPGDPGNQVFEALGQAGYEGYLIDRGDDLDVWAQRQAALGIEPDECDGIAGKRTRSLLALTNHSSCGLWVKRPGDAEYVAPAE